MTTLYECFECNHTWEERSQNATTSVATNSTSNSTLTIRMCPVCRSTDVETYDLNEQMDFE